MKKTLMVGAVVAMISSVLVMAAAYTDKPIGQVLGFGAKISNTSVGSIAVASGDGAASVNATTACQIGTGSNDQAGSIKYRDNWILDGDGGISILSYGRMLLKYAIYAEDWFEGGGYVPNASLVGTNGLAVYGAKFSETADRGTWLATVVDGGGDNAEVIGIMTDERNGILRLVPNNAAADGINAQMQGESFVMRSGYFSAFNTRFLLSSTNVEARIGLHLAGTTASITTPGTDYIGFYATNSGVNTVSIYFQAARGTTNVSVLCGNVLTSGFSTMGFGVAHAAAEVVVTFNGATITNFPISATGYITGEALSPVMAIRDNTTGQGFIKMDYIGTIQQR